MSVFQRPNILPAPEANYLAFKSLVPVKIFLRHGRLTLVSKDFWDLKVQIHGYSKTCLEVGLGCVDETGSACGTSVALLLDFQHHRAFPLKIDAKGRRFQVPAPRKLEASGDEALALEEAEAMLGTVLSGFLACYYEPEMTQEPDSEIN